MDSFRQHTGRYSLNFVSVVCICQPWSLNILDGRSVSCPLLAFRVSRGYRLQLRFVK
jgi:hypothetical protein